MPLGLDFLFVCLFVGFVLMPYWSILGIAAELSGKIPRARPSLLYTDTQTFSKELIAMIWQPGINKMVSLKRFKRWSFGF